MRLYHALYRPPHKEWPSYGRRHFHKSLGFYLSRFPTLILYAKSPPLFNHWNSLASIYAQDLSAGKSTNKAPANLDVVVDFISPIQPGCDVSYWCLMAPSSQKFWQWVWVFIQVVPPKEHCLPDLMESLLIWRKLKIIIYLKGKQNRT